MDKAFVNMAFDLIGRADLSTHSNKTKGEKFAEGRDLWYQYQRINGYAFRPSEEGLRKLSQNLDLNIPYLRSRINLFLES